MKRSRFSEEQIIGVLEEQEAGMATAEVCRRHGISPATFYQWKSKYGGLEVSEARRLGRVRQRGGKLGIAEVAVDHAATVVICGVLASLSVGMRSAMGSVCM